MFGFPEKLTGCQAGLLLSQRRIPGAGLHWPLCMGELLQTSCLITGHHNHQILCSKVNTASTQGKLHFKWALIEVYTQTRWEGWGRPHCVHFSGAVSWISADLLCHIHNLNPAVTLQKKIWWNHLRIFNFILTMLFRDTKKLLNLWKKHTKFIYWVPSPQVKHAYSQYCM